MSGWPVHFPVFISFTMPFFNMINWKSSAGNWKNRWPRTSVLFEKQCTLVQCPATFSWWANKRFWKPYHVMLHMSIAVSRWDYPANLSFIIWLLTCVSHIRVKDDVPQKRRVEMASVLLYHLARRTHSIKHNSLKPKSYERERDSNLYTLLWVMHTYVMLGAIQMS